MNTYKVLKRQKELIAFIKENDGLTIAQMCKAFKTSQATIRRDLNTLTKSDGLIWQSGKGLFYYGNPGSKKDENLSYIEGMVDFVIDLIPNDLIIYLNEGKIVQYIASKIRERGKKLTIITSDPDIAVLFIDQTKIEVHILGGKVNATSGNIDGLFSFNFLAKLGIDFSFIECSSINPKFGILFQEPMQVNLLKHVAEQSRNFMVLCRGLNVNDKERGSVFPFSLVDRIITTKDVSSKDIDLLKNFQIPIVQC